MHRDEMWQVYAPNGEPIPGEGWDSSLDNPTESSDKIIGVTSVFLFRQNNGKLEILWQKRAEGVSRYAGYYDISAGGHINLGETVIEASIRELQEEIGVTASPDELRFAFAKPFSPNCFARVFMIDWTGRPEDFHFDDNEVSEVRWVPYDELADFVKTFAKPPIREDDAMLPNISYWLQTQGLVDGNLQTK